MSCPRTKHMAYCVALTNKLVSMDTEIISRPLSPKESSHHVKLKGNTVNSEIFIFANSIKRHILVTFKIRD